MKTCTKCGEVKLFAEFHKHRGITLTEDEFVAMKHAREAAIAAQIDAAIGAIGRRGIDTASRGYSSKLAKIGRAYSWRKEQDWRAEYRRMIG